jgi:hypothetical protein
MKRAMMVLGKVIAGLLVVAAIAAMLLLVGAQFWPGAADLVINVGSDEIPMVGVFGAGIVSLFVAWAALAVALVVGAFAVVFALFLTAVALAFSAAVVGFPFIVGGLIVWLIMRRKNSRHTHGASNGGSIPPPAANSPTVA